MCDDDHVTMCPYCHACDHIIWRAATIGDGAMHTYTTQRTHTRLTYALIRTPTPACMHVCMLPRLPRTAMRHYIRIHHPHRTPQYTLHLHIPSAVQPHTHAHCNTPNPATHCNTHTTTYRSLRVPPRSRRDRRQETTQTHITPTAITTTMTMCDDM